MQNIIVIGGSAVTLEPLCDLLKALPSQLPASVFVVIHIPEKNSALEQVLGRCGEAWVAKAMTGTKWNVARFMWPRAEVTWF